MFGLTSNQKAGLAAVVTVVTSIAGAYGASAATDSGNMQTGDNLTSAQLAQVQEMVNYANPYTEDRKYILKTLDSDATILSNIDKRIQALQIEIVRLDTAVRK